MKSIAFSLSIVVATLHFGAFAKGVKNFHEFYESLKNSAQIEETPDLVETYLANREALPRYGYVSEISPGARKAMIALAAEVCAKRVALEVAMAADRRVFFPELVLNGDGTPIAPASRRMAMQRLARAFWGRDPRESELKTLDEVADLFTTGPAAQRQVALALCLSVASAFQTIAYY
jgi:hypothetical protein